jgi:hypothetical protein
MCHYQAGKSSLIDLNKKVNINANRFFNVFFNQIGGQKKHPENGMLEF